MEKRTTDLFTYVIQSGSMALSGNYQLTNQRADHYDSVEIHAKRQFANGHTVFASYTHSSAHTNAALDYMPTVSVRGQQQSGPLAWDVPNRILSWGWLPLLGLVLWMWTLAHFAPPTPMTIGRGEKAEIHGEILADDITVRGRVTGRIRARKVQLSATSHVEGDILHEAFSVEAGAFFEGNCRHSDNPLGDEVKKPVQGQVSQPQISPMAMAPAGERVKISTPSLVTPIMCSNWADSEPSTVRTVHLSTGSACTSKPPMFTMGSIVKIIPVLMRSPWPRLP